MVIARIKALKLPLRSIVIFLICVGGLLAFIPFFIYPQQSAMAEADREIKELKGRIEEQKVLYPIFQDLLRKADFKGAQGLPFPKRTKLKQHDTVKILSIFKNIAQENHLTMVDIQSDIESLVSSSSHMKIDLTVEGRFFDLRNFMLDLGELPYLDHIERIQIRPNQEMRTADFQIWIIREG